MIDAPSGSAVLRARFGCRGGGLGRQYGRVRRGDEEEEKEQERPAAEGARWMRCRGGRWRWRGWWRTRQGRACTRYSSLLDVVAVLASADVLCISSYIVPSLFCFFMLPMVSGPVSSKTVKRGCFSAASVKSRVDDIMWIFIPTDSPWFILAHFDANVVIKNFSGEQKE